MNSVLSFLRSFDKKCFDLEFKSTIQRVSNKSAMPRVRTVYDQKSRNLCMDRGSKSEEAW